MNKKIKEGRRIKVSPFDALIPFIMVNRSGSENTINLTFPCENIEKLVRELRSKGYDSIGFQHVILAAFVRTVSQRPRLNRFIRGQRLYARNEIVVNMDVKKKMTIDSENTAIKMHFSPADTIFDVHDEFNRCLKEAFENPDNDFEKVLKAFNGIPRLIKKNIFWLLRCLDYFGLIPSSLIDVSPFHGSMFITNLASLNIPPVRHHLYDFGNVPIFIAFGMKRYNLTLDEEGNVKKERVIDLVLNLDERICDGFYYASAMKLFRKYMTNPELLLEPPDEIIVDK